MLKWFVLLWFMQWRTLLSLPVIDKNIRESRQLNFGECCPCPNLERSPKHDDVLRMPIEEASADNSCPCRSATDSESASSIFTPALRVVEPFIRPVERKEDPKPLLKPEVGLASSVLETLREATDEEYQEALVRDAARSAIIDIQEDLLEQGHSGPKNIVNIILQPKDDIIDDAMPEASHVQETRCIHSSLGKAKSLNQIRVKPPNKMFSEVFPLSKATNSHRKYFDMINSASNTQEHVLLPPLKNHFLEDIKLKSDLLKIKLFPSIKNDLKDTEPNINTPNQFDGQSVDNSTNILGLRFPRLKLASIIDYLKASKQKNILSNSPFFVKEIDKNQENDFMLPPSYLNKHSIKNNGRDTFDSLQNNKLYTEDIPKLKNIFNPEDISEKSKITGMKENDTSEQSKQQMVSLAKTNLKEKDLSIKNDFIAKNDCDIYYNEEPLTDELLTNIDNKKNVDAVLSPSEIKEIKKSVSEISADENDLDKQRNLNNDINNDFNEEITGGHQKKILIEESVPREFDRTEKEENDKIIIEKENNNDPDNKSNEENLCNVEDSKLNSKSNYLLIDNIQQDENPNANLDNSNEPIARENKLLNDQVILLTTTEKGIFEHNLGKIKKINTIPNIKADILETLENFKKANERIQEKLRSKVQSALNLDLAENNRMAEIETTTTNTVLNDLTEENNEVKCNITIQDLQVMSDRILNLSLTSEKPEVTTPLDLKSFLNNDPPDTGDTDNNIDASELKDNIIATNYFSEMTEPTLPLSHSAFRASGEEDALIKTVDEKQDHVDLNKINSVPKKNLCDNIEPKNSDLTGVNTSDDRENEMVSQASSPFVKSIRHTDQDFIDQRKPIMNVNEFLGNLKSSVSDILNNNQGNVNTHNGNDKGNDNSHINSIFLRKHEQPNFAESSLRLSEQRNINKQNNFNLNSYKAKVGSPHSLHIKEIPSLLNMKENVLQRSYIGNPDVKSDNNISRNLLVMPNSSGIKSMTENARNNFNPEYNLQKLNPLENILPTPVSLNSFSENLKSRTEEALRNIQESFDDIRKLQARNKDNILGETLTKPNIFRTTLKNDLSEKLQAFNSDLRDKLSLMSRRIPEKPILHSHISPFHVSNKKNKINYRINSNPKYNSQAKSNISPNNQNSALKPNIPQPSLSSTKKNDLLKSNLQHKSYVSPHQKGSNLMNIEPQSKLRQDLGTKSPLRKEIKRKPLKENKVTFSFTTTVRPEMRSLINLPKSSMPFKNPLQRRLEIKSKLKPGEPRTLASERYTTHIALPQRKIDKSKTFSSLEESVILPISDLSQEAASLKRSDLSIESVSEGYKPDNVILSKLRDAVKTSSNRNVNKNVSDNRNNLKAIAASDTTHSASNNVNTATSSFAEKALKENVSYKCKMICFEDDINFK